MMYRFEVPCRAIGTQMIRDEGRRVDLAPVPGSAQQVATGTYGSIKNRACETKHAYCYQNPPVRRAPRPSTIQIFLPRPPALCTFLAQSLMLLGVAGRSDFTAGAGLIVGPTGAPISSA